VYMYGVVPAVYIYGIYVLCVYFWRRYGVVYTYTMCMWGSPPLHISSRYIHKVHILHIYILQALLHIYTQSIHIPYLYCNHYCIYLHEVYIHTHEGVCGADHHSISTPDIYTKYVYSIYIYCRHYSIHIHEVYIDIHECMYGLWSGYG